MPDFKVAPTVNGVALLRANGAVTADNLPISQTTTTGVALSVVRNLAAASTDSPLVSFLQDNASDDQPAVKIEQDGSGSILQLFSGATQAVTVTSTGSVGIGVTNPVVQVEAVSLATSASADRGIIIGQHSASINSSVLMMRKSRGTRASPAVIVNGDTVADIIFAPYDGTAYIHTAHIVAVTSGAVSSGTVPTDLVFCTGDTDDDVLAFETVRITSAGRMGILKPAPTAILHVVGGLTTGSTIKAERNLAAASTDSPVVSILQDHASDDQAALVVESDGTGNIATFMDGATVIGEFRDGGTLNVGAVNALATDVINASGTGTSIGIHRYIASAAGPALTFTKSRNASVGSHTVVVADDELGKIFFFGSDGSAYRQGAQIVAYVDGTPGASDMPGRIEFQVTPDASATPVTAMVIKSTGKVGIGTSSPPFQLSIEGDAAVGQMKRINAANVNRSPAFLFIRARGTVGAEADITANDWLGKVQFQGRLSGVDTEHGAFGFIATDTSQHGYFGFFDKDLSTVRVAIPNAGGMAIGGSVLAPNSMLDIEQPTVGSAVQQLSSTTTNSKPTEIVYQNKVLTTNATVTTIHTFTIPASTAYVMSGWVIGRRTGGSGGAAEDCGLYKVELLAKNTAGVASVKYGAVTLYSEDQAGMDVTFSATGATILLRVTGVTNINISWVFTGRVYQLST